MNFILKSVENDNVNKAYSSLKMKKDMIATVITIYIIGSIINDNIFK